MRIFLFLLASLLISTPVLAQVDTSGLTTAQKAQIVLQIEKMKDEGTGTQPERMKQYAQVGAEIGTAIASTAKELSVSVTEFAATPVGKWTMFLITWKVVGAALVHVVGGVLWFAVMLPLWFYMYRRFCVIDSITKTGTGFWKDKAIHYKSPDGDAVIGFFGVLAIICGVGMAVIFTM